MYVVYMNLVLVGSLPELLSTVTQYWLMTGMEIDDRVEVVMLMIFFIFQMPNKT